MPQPSYVATFRTPDQTLFTVRVFGTRLGLTEIERRARLWVAHLRKEEPAMAPPEPLHFVSVVRFDQPS